jgi:hypothetical protein
VERLAGQVMRRVIDRETDNPVEPIKGELSIRKPVPPEEITALKAITIT